MQKNSIELESLASLGPQPAYLEPLIREIWPTRADEINALFVNGGSNIDPETDHPFAIKVAGEYVGITGFYRYSDSAVGLCWHGVAPAMRGNGISRAAFKEVCALALKTYPAAREIVDLIPSDRNSELVPYFRKLGFSHDGEIATFDYLPKGLTWRVYRAPLAVRSPIVQSIRRGVSSVLALLCRLLSKQAR